jgi:heptose-I-phosphate ethanolaminephosphotransferase
LKLLKSVTHAGALLVLALGWLTAAVWCLWRSPEPGVGPLLLALAVALLQVSFALWIGTLAGRARIVALVGYGAAAEFSLLALLVYREYLGGGGVRRADSLRAFGQASLAEIWHFVRLFVDWRLVATSALVAGLLFVLVVTAVGSEPGRRRRYPRVVAAIALLASVGSYLAGGHRQVSEIVEFVSEYREQARLYRSVENEIGLASPVGAESTFSGTLVVVIGESLAKAHMGVYGYPVETTPMLSKRREEYVVFQDVISPHSHTVAALGIALTTASETADFEYLPQGEIDLISLARGAGFEVSWLSNQNEYGIWDNPITALARRADRDRFFSTSLGDFYLPTLFDDAMLPTLRATLSAPGAQKRLIFLHLMANHWPYCGNHPGQFDRVEDARGPSFYGAAAPGAEADCYDGGVRYLDWFLEQVVREIEATDSSAGVLFLGDHGEAPLLGTGHDQARHSIYHLEIPLVLWANDAFASRNPEKLNQAGLHRDRPYTIADLYHAIADLLDIRHPSVLLERSLFHPSFEDRPRTALRGWIRYDEWSRSNDFRENFRVALGSLGRLGERIWAHRVNSLGALFEAMASFKGVECDVSFDPVDGVFRVFHSPAPDTGLTLEAMLAASRNRPDLRYWLDWKNASGQNLGAAMARLEELDQRFGLRRRILVETGAHLLSPASGQVSERGFEHAYYLPTDEVLGCLEECGRRGRDELAARLSARIRSGGFTALTFDWRLAPFVEEELAAVIAERQLRLFSWDLGIGLNDRPTATEEVLDRFRRFDLSGLLVPFPSAFRI